MRPRANKYLRDIHDAARSIARFAEANSCGDHESDVSIRSGVAAQSSGILPGCVLS